MRRRERSALPAGVLNTYEDTTDEQYSSGEQKEIVSELQALRVAHRRRAEANTKARAMEKAALHEDYGRKGACDAPACVRSSHPAYLRYHLSDTLSMHWFLIVQWRRLRVRRVRSSGDSVAV